MKTSKAKATRKPKKTSAVVGAVKRRKVIASKSVPGEEEIRKIAGEIYHQRLASGEEGTALGDWLKAEELLKGS